MGVKNRVITGLFKNKKIPLTKEIFLDETIVKVFDGIAGGGKSTFAHTLFTEYKEDYCRFTSTNKLSRESREKFSVPCDTIAAGMFHTLNGCFYSKKKEVSCKNVVIDEIMQADVRAFSWVNSFVGKNNIIICTDSKQMLSPGSEKQMIEKLRELYDSAFVVTFLESNRAITDETKRVFSFLYNKCGSGVLCKFAKKHISSIQIDSLSYNREDIYICRSNEIEKMLYDRWHLCERYDLGLIPKGTISKKQPKDLKKYPIIPQAMLSNRISGYLQISNVSTVTRMQGSEAGIDGNVYFFADGLEAVSDRELYTAITRVRDIRRFFFVNVSCKNQSAFSLSEFNGKPIRECAYLMIDGSAEVDGMPIRDFLEEEGEKISIDSKIFAKLLNSMSKNGDLHFRENGLIVDGDFVGIKKSSREVPDVNVLSLINKDPQLDIKQMDLFMKLFEDSQKKAMRRVYVDNIMCPMVSYQGRMAESPFPDAPAYSEVIPKESYKYALDLKSSYIHCLINAKLPTSFGIYDAPIEGGIDWYIVYCTQVPPGCLVTGALVDLISKEEDVEAYYVCSSSAKTGTPMATKWHDMSHKDIESSQKVKGIFWGVLEKPWLFGCNYKDCVAPEYYARERTNRFQLLMAAIKSEQARIMIRFRKAIYGDIYSGYVLADCLYFDFDGDICKLGECLHELEPGFDFRIVKNTEDKESSIYATFDKLRSKEDIRKDKERLRRNACKRSGSVI